MKSSRLSDRFSDLTGSKVRPAVVVQADYLAALIDDTILVKITSRRFGLPGTEVTIDPALVRGPGVLWVKGRQTYEKRNGIV